MSKREQVRAGALIVNADDWGRDCRTTDRTLDCIEAGSVSAVSAMVFMDDSERAATIACDRGIDAGLHLNLTAPFSAPNVDARLLEHQARLAGFLSRHSFARAVYNPVLASSFQYVVAAQIDEYRKLHGTDPARIDGHHHMHLCANVLLDQLLPSGTIVRPHFSFEAGEKFRNRVFRITTAAMLRTRHHSVDFFFSLWPIKPASRLQRIVSLAQHFIVEVETHPVNPGEYLLLTSGEFSNQPMDALDDTNTRIRQAQQTLARGMHS